MKQKVENTIPVYDICTLQNDQHLHESVIAEPFLKYLTTHPNLHIAHRHSFFHIVLFTEGSGFHTIDFQQFEVKAGQIYFMIPGQVHSWSFDAPVDGFIINFSSALINSLVKDIHFLEQFTFFRGVATDSVIQLPAAAVQEVREIMANILKESKSEARFNNEMMCAQLLTLLITVSRESGLKDNAKIPLHNQLILQNFTKLVEQYYTEKRLPKEYAALLYITANHLNALCQDLLGKSAGTIIRDRILLEAKRLLINAQLSIAEIAYQLNFKDNSYFTKFFKKITNQTPEEFRKASFGI